MSFILALTLYPPSEVMLCSVHPKLQADGLKPCECLQSHLQLRTQYILKFVCWGGSITVLSLNYASSSK